ARVSSSRRASASTAHSRLSGERALTPPARHRAAPEPMTTRSIGARIPRNEDPRLLQGLGCFVDDVNPPGALHAASLRSPHAHARIAQIDATAARRVPGVHLVLTAADLGELNERLTIERSCGSPIEARGVVAEWDARRRVLRVWDSTQAPLPIKNGLAGLFGLPEFNVEVVAPDVGGGFGTKIMLFYPEEILVPHAAMTLGRPVKWTEDRREHLIAANQERGQIHEVEVGIDETGRILALRDR